MADETANTHDEDPLEKGTKSPLVSDESQLENNKHINKNKYAPYTAEDAELFAPFIKIYNVVLRWWDALKETEKTNRIIAIFTMVIAITGIVYTFFAGEQWKAMERQLTQLNTQNTLMRQQLVGTQAAVLRASHSFDIEGFTFGLANTRDVDAINIYVKITITPVSLPNGLPLASPIIREFRPKRVEKDNGFTERLPIPWSVQRDMQEGWPGKETVKVSGEYSYEDGFGDKIPGAFCDLWTPILNIRTKIENATVGGALPCDAARTIIDNLLRRKREADQKNNQSPN
jgi:hypothetical protein